MTIQAKIYGQQQGTKSYAVMQCSSTRSSDLLALTIVFKTGDGRLTKTGTSLYDCQTSKAKVISLGEEAHEAVTANIFLSTKIKI